MLVRFIVDNLYSFGKRTEFNTLPGKPRTLSEHVYTLECGVKVLKLSALYGANAAGKSNLVKAIALLQRVVLHEESAMSITDNRFKLSRHGLSDDQTVAVEFIQSDMSFIYAIKVNQGRIATEELYLSGKSKDVLVYKRVTNSDNITTIQFSQEFERDERNMTIASVLIDEFVEADKTVLGLLAKRDIEQLRMAKLAYDWFKESLLVLPPESKSSSVLNKIEIDEEFGKFVQAVLCSYHIGITGVKVIVRRANELGGDDVIGREWNKRFRDNMLKPLQEVRFYKEDDEYWVKYLQISHRMGASSGESIPFDISEESDGTVKLLNLLPAIYDVIHNRHVYVIDELERSIHPSLIKELVRKFSHDDKSLGQLIFTTHESVLLDQNIFRQDEIWFAEKDNGGCTELYSLSQYREHKTIDIRKGYLEGRYGAIPFLGNLEDLNWHDNRE